MGHRGKSTDVSNQATFDRIADALGRNGRRQLLLELLDHNPVEYETGATDTVSSGQTVSEVAMVHTHLPKLDEMGYVSWEDDSGRVVRGDRWDEIEPTLRVLADNQERLPGDVF